MQRAERGPARSAPVWLASWLFWLTLATAAIVVVVHTVQANARVHQAWRQVFRLEGEICKRFAAAPRPSANACWERAGRAGDDLLDPRGTADPP